MTALNPVFTVGNELTKAFRIHQGASRSEDRGKAVEMLETVGVPIPRNRVKEYPHELSGGIRQRVMSAMALACRPGLLIADEPTTALDVTIQAQILDLMERLRQDSGTAIIMITHDLGVIAEISHRVVVIYAGRIMEQTSTLELFDRPLHPYTQGLMQAIPSPEATRKTQELYEIRGVVPSLPAIPSGCRFQPRCPHVQDICREKEPDLMRSLRATGPRAGWQGMSEMLQVRNLVKYFPVLRGFFGREQHYVRAVDGVSLSVAARETLGLVGESGCGKSTAGRAILRLIEPTSGEVWFQGQNILSLVGIVLGLVSGYYWGRLDSLIMRTAACT